MKEKVENAIKDLLSSLQIAKLYTTVHPVFTRSVDKACDSILDALQDKSQLVIGIVGDELAFEKDIFFDLSKTARPMISYLKSRGIEKITFSRELQKEELVKFIDFLIINKDEVKKQPQEYLSVVGVKNIAVSKLESSKAFLDSGGGGSAVLYEDSLGQVTQNMESVMNNQNIDYLTLKFSMANIADSFLSQYKEFMKLTTIKRYDVNTFMHILNVAILSMYFSSKLGFSRQDVLDIGTAALFHDIGKLYISRKIIKKTDKLTDEEFSAIRSHVVLGADILIKYVDSIGALPMIVAFEHHLKYDGKGYPKLAFFQKPHIASLIVAICDVYDALSQRRSYKRDYPPNMIHEIMMKDKGTGFDPELLDKFFKIMGVWPIGTLLILSDGSKAVVREENEDDIFCPKVEVIYPEEQRRLIDLKETKETIQIQSFINPLKEGKQLSELI